MAKYEFPHCRRLRVGIEDFKKDLFREVIFDYYNSMRIVLGLKEQLVIVLLLVKSRLLYQKLI